MTGNEEYSLIWKNHGQHLEDTINKFMANQEFCNVTVFIEKQKVKAHRLILATFSGYFKKLFHELEEDSSFNVVITDIEFDIFQYVLEFIYKGKTTVPSNKIENFMKAVDFFEIYSITNKNTSKRPNETTAINTEVKPQQFLRTSKDVEMSQDNISSWLRPRQYGDSDSNFQMLTAHTSDCNYEHPAILRQQMARNSQKRTIQFSPVSKVQVEKVLLNGKSNNNNEFPLNDVAERKSLQTRREWTPEYEKRMTESLPHFDRVKGDNKTDDGYDMEFPEEVHELRCFENRSPRLQPATVSHVDDGYRFRCHLCFQTFERQDMLRSHLLELHARM